MYNSSMTMHLEQGLTMINTRKPRKAKITKKRMVELKAGWYKHNKSMKQKGMSEFKYETLEEYIDYRYNRIKGPKPGDYQIKQEPTKDIQKEAEEHRKKYPSMMETQMKNGTFNKTSDSGMRKKESPKYTGDLLEGIATMHKSNAVPVMKGTNQAIDIARMRRG